jgi:hypothetical protein
MATNQSDLLKIPVYHITDFENLFSIIEAGGLNSDSQMQCDDTPTEVIGYPHIKKRRMTTKVPCCDNRFVGEFVPFYFCPRSPMLYTINKGNTGREIGCQKNILHLVSNIEKGISLAKPWAISDGNAGSAYPIFKNDLFELTNLDWSIINSTNWGGDRLHKKAAEFLVADFFPWNSILQIGCYDQVIADKVTQLLCEVNHKPTVSVNLNWYYY